MKVLVGGDYCPIGTAEAAAIRAETGYWGPIEALIRQADLTLVNLEVPLYQAASSTVKTGPTLGAHPKVLRALTQHGIQGVTLANNHLGDQGPEGVLSTLKACQDAGLSTVGAGPTLNLARRPLSLECRGLHLAVLNVADTEWGMATADRPGANPMDWHDNAQDIREARANHDHVLVIVHGGHEQYNLPSPQTAKRLKFYVEMGATAVVAHHAHCISGVMVHRGSPIAFGLGNLLFPPFDDYSEWTRGATALFHFEQGKPAELALNFHGQCRQGDMKLQYLNPSEAAEMEVHVQKLGAIIADENRLNGCWNDFIRMQAPYVRSILDWPHPFFAKVARRLGLSNPLERPAKRARLLNMARCEAHREVLVDSLAHLL